MTDDFRRADDRRIVELDKKVSGMAKTVGEIRDMLISEPEASPLGRALSRRADANAAAITNHEGRIDGLERWRDEAIGAGKATRIVQVLLGIVVALIAIYNFLRPPA